MRPKILTLMGYPPSIGDDEYDQETIEPDWDAVLEHLIANPSEASYFEDEAYPLDDALWIENHPVPAEVVIRFLRINPTSLSSSTLKIANENESTHPEVLRILRAAGVLVDSLCSEKRTKLVQLMGFPPDKYDNDYWASDIEPDWEAVRKRLVLHPEEARVHEAGCYPLADALSIEWDPVPIDVVDTLVRLAPESLTDEAFKCAGENEELGIDMLQFLFKADKNVQKRSEESFVKVKKFE